MLSAHLISTIPPAAMIAERNRRLYEWKKFITDEHSGLKYEPVGDCYLIAGEDEPEERERYMGQRHLRYLKEHRRVRYTNLLTSGELNAYLADIDRRAEVLFLRLVCQMANVEGISETMKTSDQMK